MRVGEEEREGGRKREGGKREREEGERNLIIIKHVQYC